jgi:tetratricopeptide (TPR) repeat protein
VQRVLDPEDKEKQCDLLLDLCDALLLVPDTGRVLETEAPAAFSLAESLGDGSRAVRACMAATGAITYSQTNWATPEMDRWVERADRYAQPGTVERALADGFLGLMKFAAGDFRSGIDLITQALDLARRLGAPEVLPLATYLLVFRSAPQHTAENLRLVEELWEGQHIGKKAWSGMMPAHFLCETLLSSGQRRRVEESYGELRTLAKRTGIINLELLSASHDLHLVVMDGRLEEAMDMTENIQTRSEEVGLAGATVVGALLCDTRARIYLGAPLEALESGIRSMGGSMFSGLSLVLAHLGRQEEASEILEREVVRRPGIGTAEDETVADFDVLYLEAALLIGHRQVAELLLNRLSGSGYWTTGSCIPTCTIRHLGGAAALLGRYDEARQHYQEAIKVCTEMPFRPELALTRLQLAELLLEHYPDEKAEAMEHLDFAIKEFREMKMQPSLERALRHKEIMGA